MRISDWSSDVCSSDLYNVDLNVYNGRLPSYCSGTYRSSNAFTLENQGELWGNGGSPFCGDFLVKNSTTAQNFGVGFPSNCTDLVGYGWGRALFRGRPEETRVGQEAVSTCNLFG